MERHIDHAKATLSLLRVGKRLEIISAPVITPVKQRSEYQWMVVEKGRYTTRADFTGVGIVSQRKRYNVPISGYLY
jgi:hypothetical protein